MNDKMPDPLPREWLPDAAAHAGSSDPQLWERRLRRLMAAAEPALARLRARGTPWWAVLGAWWRPTLGVAAAAAAALVLVLRTAPAGPVAPPPGTLALSAVVGDGEPAALWAGLGSEADPVLALIVLEGETP